MFDALRTRTLRLLRVPHDPEPPMGAPGSVRVFRAGKNLYKLRLLGWLLGQAGALVGIVFSLGFLHSVETGVTASRQTAQQSVRAETTQPASSSSPVATAAPSEPRPSTDASKASPAKSRKGKLSRAQKQSALAWLTRLVERWPWWIFPVLALFEFIGIAIYVVQIPFTYAMVRLDYELRWYIVTDRSLRIRTGLATVQESTMSFANVQQVVVSQGPLQRVLGIADVRVQSAGGGGESAEAKAGDSLHTGVFHGVENASEIRDLILARLREFRETGLGDPDEPTSAVARSAEAGETSVPSATPATSLALAAAHELLQEARALRAVLR